MKNYHILGLEYPFNRLMGFIKGITDDMYK